jgi:transglutaminase-like putative cysteine protease
MALWSALLSRSARTPQTARPSLTLFFLLVGAFLLTLVPQIVQFPLWLTATIIVGMVVRSVLQLYRLPLPSTTFCGILAIVLLGGIFLQYGAVMGRAPGTAFTAGLLTIKFFELRGPRDVALVIFSCFFVVMSALLYSQVLELFVYCLIMMWVLTSLLLRVHTGDQPHDHLLRMLGKSGIIFLQALPLALFLFFFFPRYQGTFSLSLDESKIGLSDTVAPGSIAKLSTDDSEAMYVHFLTPNVPTIDTMYWRALVLWDYHNGMWTPGPLAGVPESPQKPAGPDSNDVRQEIIVRAHNQKWLFALDVPISAPVNASEQPSWAIVLNGNVVQLQSGKLNHMARYDVTSNPYPAEVSLTDAERKFGSQLPADSADHIDPAVQQLADQLHQGFSDSQEQEYIYAVLKFFRHNGFIYSTAPGIQGPNWLSVFLFKDKRGFCEHFASAFAVLMRLENIPARLVVGYRGADYNPYSDDYIVSQSNAHAWDEVWMPSDNLPPATSKVGRWVRVDPTALVAMAGELPDMASANAADAQDTLSSQVNHHDLSLAETYLPVWLRDSLKEMQLRREQMETGWDNLVLSYDPETQFRLAQALGFGGKAQVSLLLVCVAAGGICLLLFRKWLFRKSPVSPVENLYAAFCRTMARRGIPRAAWEGPLAYTERVAEAFPDDRPAIERVGSIVAHFRYGPARADASHHDLKSLLTLITASQAATASRDRR